MSEAVDWGLALATGVRTASSGPEMSMTEAAAEVAALREAAAAVVEPVAGITALSAPEAPPAVVVDRAEWIRSNAGALRTVLTPLTDGERQVGGFAQPVSSRLAGLQLGLALGWLSGKVLGQYEALPAESDGPQRLLLVAPNIVQAATVMGVDEHDFRLWVCMHEETHRVQFGAHPWLSEYFAGEVAALVRGLDVGPAELAARLASGIRNADSGGVAGWLQSPQMRSRMSGLMALMSLLEGHADWVMDQSEEVVPSAARLRVAFEQRRRGGGLLDAVLRRLLGLDAKLAQYREGAAFTRAVIDQVGLSGFNKVWSGPATLPLAGEINDSTAWVARVRSM